MNLSNVRILGGRGELTRPCISGVSVANAELAEANQYLVQSKMRLLEKHLFTSESIFPRTPFPGRKKQMIFCLESISFSTLSLDGCAVRLLATYANEDYAALLLPQRGSFHRCQLLPNQEGADDI